MSEVKETVLKWITDNWKQGNISDNWPQFSPLTASTKQDLIDKLNLQNDNKTVVMVVEKDSSFLGREVEFGKKIFVLCL